MSTKESVFKLNNGLIVEFKKCEGFSSLLFRIIEWLS